MDKTDVFDKATTEVYLSHGEFEGELFSHPPNAVYPTLTTALHFALLSILYRISMVYFNNTDNANFRYTCSESGKFEAYPFQGGALATGEVNVQVDSYGRLSYSDQHWPRVIHQTRPYHPSQYSSLANPVPAPSSGKNLFCIETFGKRTDQSQIVPLHYRGANQSGPSTNAFHTVSPRARSASRNHVNAFPNRMWNLPVNPAPARPGPYVPYDRNRPMEFSPVPILTSAGTRRRGHQP